MSQTKGGGTTGGGTGTICSKNGLYKATDGRIEFIRLIAAGEAFPFFPGGDGTKKTTWSLTTVSSDGSKTSFTAVKVAAGTI